MNDTCYSQRLLIILILTHKWFSNEGNLFSKPAGKVMDLD